MSGVLALCSRLPTRGLRCGELPAPTPLRVSSTRPTATLWQAFGHSIEPAAGCGRATTPVGNLSRGLPGIRLRGELSTRVILTHAPGRKRLSMNRSKGALLCV